MQTFDWELVQDERRKKIVELCANQCVLYQDSCDAFYVKLKGFYLPKTIKIVFKEIQS